MRVVAAIDTSFDLPSFRRGNRVTPIVRLGVLREKRLVPSWWDDSIDHRGNVVCLGVRVVFNVLVGWNSLS